MQLVLQLAYKGTRYHGFARTRPHNNVYTISTCAHEGKVLPTVQAELESALSTIFRRTIELVCAGRTDAGVHAYDQFVNFMLDETEELELVKDPKRFALRLLKSLNALLSSNITIRAIYQAHDDFSSRFSALWRLYRYRLKIGACKPCLAEEFVTWEKRELNTKAMQEALVYLRGEHDFASFCKSRSAQGKNTRRTILGLELFEEELLGEKTLCLEIKATAFLHSMVRTIMGSLIEIGAGHRDPSWIQEVLAAKDRSAAGPNAPAKGLCLWQLAYREGDLIKLL